MESTGAVWFFFASLLLPFASFAVIAFDFLEAAQDLNRRERKERNPEARKESQMNPLAYSTL